VRAQISRPSHFTSAKGTQLSISCKTG